MCDGGVSSRGLSVVALPFDSIRKSLSHPVLPPAFPSVSPTLLLELQRERETLLAIGSPHSTPKHSSQLEARLVSQFRQLIRCPVSLVVSHSAHIPHSHYNRIASHGPVLRPSNPQPSLIRFRRLRLLQRPAITPSRPVLPLWIPPPPTRRRTSHPTLSTCRSGGIHHRPPTGLSISIRDEPRTPR
jgi:hypothetical protein